MVELIAKSLRGQFITIRKARELIKERFGLDIKHYQMLTRYHGCIGGILRGNAGLKHGAKSLCKIWNDEVEEFLQHVKDYYSTRMK